jgi:hypothetical protein
LKVERKAHNAGTVGGHVGPTCKKKSRGSIVGTLAGVRRKKQAPKNRRSPYS